MQGNERSEASARARQAQRSGAREFSSCARLGCLVWPGLVCTGAFRWNCSGGTSGGPIGGRELSSEFVRPVPRLTLPVPRPLLLLAVQQVLAGLRDREVVDEPAVSVERLPQV